MSNEYQGTPPELITEPEAAKALGVAPGTLKAARLHRLQSNPLRDLPHIRIGRSVRYRRSDIAEWIERHLVGGMIDNDWMTSPDASKRYGLPTEIIAEAVARQQVRVKLENNQPFVNRADVNALALLLRTEGGCDDCG